MQIEIVPYDPTWKRVFGAERDRIAGRLGSIALRIEHHGSTAIPGLAAKPVIDIQISVARLQPLACYRDPLQSLEYAHVPHADDAVCPYFHRPRDWPHAFHVHVVKSGDEHERRTLAFRDYLCDHPAVARDYESLKRGLAGAADAGSFSSQEAYAQAKGPFIAAITDQALAQGYPRPVLIR